MNNLLKYAVTGSIGLGSLALVISAPKTARNLKPLKNERMQESELFSVFTDKETGDMYGYIEGAGGEQRFVKYDKRVSFIFLNTTTLYFEIIPSTQSSDIAKD